VGCLRQFGDRPALMADGLGEALSGLLVAVVVACRMARFVPVMAQSRRSSTIQGVTASRR